MRKSQPTVKNAKRSFNNDNDGAECFVSIFRLLDVERFAETAR